MLELSIPPVPEQAAIACYLDHADRRIRRCIGTKKKLITLLKEHKQAVIQQAVTGQIDVRTGQPYPAYKDSGVEWLGEVPTHWEVRRLGASVQKCVNGVWGSDPNDRDDLACVRVADFDRVRLRVRVTNPTLRAIMPNERKNRLLKKGDLLLEKSGGGDLQPVGVVMVYDHDIAAVCSNFIAKMSVSPHCVSRFLTYLHSHLYAIRLNVRSIKQTTGIQNLDSSSYLSELVAFPDLSEQAAITRFLDQADRRIRRAIRANQHEIELLREYRTRLIADIVTGKLDVRAAAAALPEVDPLAAEDADNGSSGDTAPDPDNRDAALEAAEVRA